jgi:hypothetical protein
MGWVVNAKPLTLYPRERPGAHCIGGNCGLQGRSGLLWKISPPTGFDPRTVHPVVNRYTNYAILTLRMCVLIYLRMYACMLTITTRPNRRLEYIEIYRHYLLIYKRNILGPLDICLCRSLS